MAIAATVLDHRPPRRGAHRRRAHALAVAASKILSGVTIPLLATYLTPLRTGSSTRGRAAHPPEESPPSTPTPHVLVIVQNLPVPLDRRVWLECQALIAQGYGVTVICPQGPDDSRYELLDGVHIHRYPPAPEAQGLAGFALEFAYSWVRTALLSTTAWRRSRFDVIQACNPPDTYWLLALLWRLRGVRFVYDHHDLCPELFLSRFGEPDGLGGRVELGALRWLERMTYWVADQAIETNGSYLRIVQERDHVPTRRLAVVRSGPDTTVMRPVYPTCSIREGAEHLLAYIGIMGPQDGVDNVLLLMDELVHRRGRTGVRAVLMGFGDCLEDLRRQCTALDLDDHVVFTGRVGPAEVREYLSAADIGLGPDMDTPLNRFSTMNKTLEYMAFGLPTVSFDLIETRASVGETGILVPSGDIGAYADAVVGLLDDVEARVELGMAARRRAVDLMDWRTQAETYVGVYDALLHHAPVPDRWPHQPRRPADDGSALVDLQDEVELRRFLSQHAGGPPELAAAADRSGRTTV